jgi:Transmembrane amino acid transporter protein
VTSGQLRQLPGVDSSGMISSVPHPEEAQEQQQPPPPDGLFVMTLDPTQNSSAVQHHGLTLLQSVLLLTADVVGVGILALPHSVSVLGYTTGLSFLLFQLPVNWYAGHLLAQIATACEQSQESVTSRPTLQTKSSLPLNEIHNVESRRRVRLDSRRILSLYTSVPALAQDSAAIDDDPAAGGEMEMTESSNREAESVDSLSLPTTNHHVSTPPSTSPEEDPPRVSTMHHSTSVVTADLVTISQHVFAANRRGAATFVQCLYYSNLFLVLGDYILVMAHAIAAVFDDMCLPTAGLVAAILMFSLTQLPTMTHLGRRVSTLSLMAMFTVLIQCLVAVHTTTPGASAVTVTNETAHDHRRFLPSKAASPETSSITQKFAALGSIGFAVGSQKLFLNIRYEMNNRHEAPKTLAYSLATFGFMYFTVTVRSGPGTFADPSMTTGEVCIPSSHIL